MSDTMRVDECIECSYDTQEMASQVMVCSDIGKYPHIKEAAIAYMEAEDRFLQAMRNVHVKYVKDCNRLHYGMRESAQHIIDSVDLGSFPHHGRAAVEYTQATDQLLAGKVKDRTANVARFDAAAETLAALVSRFGRC